MAASDWIALWGAGLSTVVAAYQIGVWRKDKPNLSVSIGIVQEPLAEEEVESARGTPIVVKRGGDDHLTEVLVGIKVANNGRRAIQISAILIEFISGDYVNYVEVVPNSLPTLLEPLTSTVATFQKEFIDEVESLTFLGVVDFRGRRYHPNLSQVREIVESCWKLPSRRRIYQRRGDAAKRVFAFQARDKATLRSVPISSFKRRFRVVIRRTPDDQLLRQIPPQPGNGQ
ncbi:hypothetical protein [Thermomonospora cellulosilytica]|uniref:Uncharacterized protein n=1 Tax=Thermomonospora cellulosilytica TaxID=1411118 RepID=A0A7W3MUD8_9ACTN|nr:hypothetical protein [Thermomonospora cellulosilytica]MBA9002066.1 hypothetical protein [Thermomonospora cellulosilytica]